MWQALNKKRERTFLAQEAIQTIPLWKQEKWTCPNCKKSVSLKESFYRAISFKTLSLVNSHFCHHPSSSCKDPKENNIHYQRQMFVLSQLYSAAPPLRIGGFIILHKFDQIKKLETKKADILIEFKEFDPLFGFGLVIEIMVSEKDESMEDKIKKWGQKGYSITWLEKNRFNKKNQLITEGIEIKLPYLKNLNLSIEKNWKELKRNLLLLSENKEMLKITNKLIEKYTCRTCKNSGPDKWKGEASGLFCCWLENNQNPDKKKQRPKKYLPTHQCNNYEPSYIKLQTPEPIEKETDNGGIKLDEFA